MVKRRANYEEHREEFLVRGKLWRVAHPGRNVENARRWYVKNKEVVLPAQKAYNALHKDEIAERNQQRVFCRAGCGHDVQDGHFRPAMLTHFRNSPSCVEIFRELAAQGDLKVPHERRLLDAYGQSEKDDQKAGKAKKRRQGQDGRAEKKKAKRGQEKAENRQEFGQQLNKEQQEAFRARFLCLKRPKRLFMLARKSKN